MELIKKNLKTVKNKLLCQLEDYILDGIIPSTMEDSEETREKMAKQLMTGILDSVKENAVEIAIICYTDKDGKELTAEQLEGIPLKMKIFQECLPDIMNIVGDFMAEDAEDKKPGKSQKVRKIPKR